MNTRLFVLLLAAILLALGAVARAGRPSSDEVAVRLGVQAWLQGRSPAATMAVDPILKTLYRPDVIATESLGGETRAVEGWSNYLSLWQPWLESVASFSAKPAGELKVSVQGDRAETAFRFASEGAYRDGRPLTCGAEVNLTWHRTEGIWQIAREELRPLDPALLIEPVRTTTQR